MKQHKGRVTQQRTANVQMPRTVEVVHFKMLGTNKHFPLGKMRNIDYHLIDVSVLSANPKFACTGERIIQKNPTNLGRREFNSTLHQSSHGFATRVHAFATKTKALAREIPPATQASASQTSVISVPDLPLADRAIYRARVLKTHKGRHKTRAIKVI